MYTKVTTYVNWLILSIILYNPLALPISFQKVIPGKIGEGRAGWHIQNISHERTWIYKIPIPNPSEPIILAQVEVIIYQLNGETLSHYLDPGGEFSLPPRTKALIIVDFNDIRYWEHTELEATTTAGIIGTRNLALSDAAIPNTTNTTTTAIIATSQNLVTQLQETEAKNKILLQKIRKKNQKNLLEQEYQQLKTQITEQYKQLNIAKANYKTVLTNKKDIHHYRDTCCTLRKEVAKEIINQEIANTSRDYSHWLTVIEHINSTLSQLNSKLTRVLTELKQLEDISTTTNEVEETNIEVTQLTPSAQNTSYPYAGGGVNIITSWTVKKNSNQKF